MIQWLKDNTLLETRTPALLPDLLGRMKECGLFSETYLTSIETRHRQAADLIAHLARLPFETWGAFTEWLLKAHPADQNEIRAKFCRFDLRFFHALGDHVRQMAEDPLFTSPFFQAAGGDAVPIGQTQQAM